MKLTTNRLRLTLATLGAAAVSLAAALPAQAAGPRFAYGNTDCTTTPLIDTLWGFATSMPTVYAANATRRRDLQNVSVRIDLYRWDGKQWALWAQGPVYRGLAADNNPVQVFATSSGTQFHLYDKHQFGIKTAGLYRVRQSIWWHRNGAVGAYSAARWIWHSAPSAVNGAFCVVI